MPPEVHFWLVIVWFFLVFWFPNLCMPLPLLQFSSSSTITQATFLLTLGCFPTAWSPRIFRSCLSCWIPWSIVLYENKKSSESAASPPHSLSSLILHLGSVVFSCLDGFRAVCLHFILPFRNGLLWLVLRTTDFAWAASFRFWPVPTIVHFSSVLLAPVPLRSPPPYLLFSLCFQPTTPCLPPLKDPPYSFMYPSFRSDALR